MVCNNLPLVVCQCCKLPLELTEISTFFVTPGALSGLHLIKQSYYWVKFLLDVCCWSGFFHVSVQDIALLASEDVEDSDSSITTTYTMRTTSKLPAAMYLSFGSKRTQKVYKDKSPKVYL